MEPKIFSISVPIRTCYADAEKKSPLKLIKSKTRKLRKTEHSHECLLALKK